MNSNCDNKSACRHPSSWTSALLPTALVLTALLFSACFRSSRSSDNGDDAGGNGEVEENGQAAEAEPQTLYHVRNLRVKTEAGGSAWQSSWVEAPGNGQISAVLDWPEDGWMNAGLRESGEPSDRQAVHHETAPITWSHRTEAGARWAVYALSPVGESRTITVSIIFTPD